MEEKKKLVWPEIERRLNRFLDFPPFCKVDDKYKPLSKFHQKMVSDYPLRKGKYVRPTLLILTAEAMGVSTGKTIKTAAAMQTSEDWILIHDDIEDDSLERRGKPTLHRLYGKELAINAGDSLHILMWQILKDNFEVIGHKKARAIIDEFVQILNRTTLGQTVEIKWTQENKTILTDRDIFFILESKTAYYTIAGPMRLGAILAGASKKQLETIYQFGQYLGRCFQIRDDLLDLTSDFSGLKKQKGNDIYEGKRTIMLAHLLRNIKGKEKDKLLKVLKKTRAQKTENEVGWVIKMMKKHGSLEYGKKLAEKLACQAKEFFDGNLGFISRNPAREQLRAGINFILERKH